MTAAFRKPSHQVLLCVYPSVLRSAEVLEAPRKYSRAPLPARAENQSLECENWLVGIRAERFVLTVASGYGRSISRV
jgi:hypothetical protein